MISNRIKNLLLLVLTLGFATSMLAGCGGGGGGGGGGSGSDSTPQPEPDALEIAFGNIVLDHSSDRAISLQNPGTSALAIGQIAQANPLAAPFSIVSDDCSGTSLGPSQSCTVQVRFLPTEQGAVTDSFDIPSADSDRDLATVSVSGTGRGLNVSLNQIDTGNCPTVTLRITVTDRNDDPVSGLLESDFSVFENDVLVDPDTFSNIVTVPISVALALDYSGSVQAAPGAIEDIEAAAKAFLEELNLDNNTDEAEIIKFAKAIQVMEPFTDIKDDLTAAIDASYTGGVDETLLFDAVWQAINDTAGRANERRAVVVISDGNDEGSTRTLAEIIDNALAHAVPLFTIGLGNVGSETDLRPLADESGGQFFFAPTSDDLRDIYVQISHILANQYILEYDSSSSGGDPITLDVEVSESVNGWEGEDSKEVTGCP